ncbi:hypothetical protein HU200_036428 [Digitaria exilis]|uniref:Uncharacterized protein n=1 Tax=Digitaria exilis TaxID=1010633 RepID=A0A835BDD9_9POAL|nr:hypothetical protein HU200_036428 [Digitaria exilis]
MTGARKPSRKQEREQARRADRNLTRRSSPVPFRFCADNFRSASTFSSSRAAAAACCSSCLMVWPPPVARFPGRGFGGISMGAIRWIWEGIGARFGIGASGKSDFGGKSPGRKEPCAARDPAADRSRNVNESYNGGETVGRILADHPGPFRSVHLSHCSLTSRERELGDWGHLLAAKGIQDLVFLDNPPLPRRFGDAFRGASLRQLPADILRCASLRRLFLGTCRFPDTAGAPRGADVFPHLKEFSMLSAQMSEQDLEHMLACSPELETLALIINAMPKRIHLRSQSLKCMLLWTGVADELAVVDAPHLERLILWQTAGDYRPMKLKIDGAPELRVLGRLHPRLHQLQIGNTVINSSRDGEATGRHNANFWQEVDPIKCVKSSVNKIFIHEFQGEQSEFGFVKFIAKRARKLQFLVIVLTKETFASACQFFLRDIVCRLPVRDAVLTAAAIVSRWRSAPLVVATRTTAFLLLVGYLSKRSTIADWQHSHQCTTIPFLNSSNPV